MRQILFSIKEQTLLRTSKTTKPLLAVGAPVLGISHYCTDLKGGEHPCLKFKAKK